MIPKTGGNRYSGSLFATGGQLRRSRARTPTPSLVARGLRTPNSLKHQSDVNPGFGGPLKRDTLWFYTSARFTRQANYVGGLFQNKNAGDITKWTYEPDPDRARLQQRHRAEREPAADLAGDRQAASSTSSTTSTGAASAASPRRPCRRRRRTTSSTRSAICDRWRTRRRRRTGCCSKRGSACGAKSTPTRRRRRSIRSGC